jgi:hypothetical protein
MCRWPSLKSKIAWGKVKFLVIKRIIGNVHLAIFSEQFSVAVDDYRGVVIDARAAFLEERRDDHDAILPRDIAQCRCGSSGNFFSEFEVFVIFCLAEILRLEKFRQTNDLRALLGGIADESDCPREIFLWLYAASHLDERDSSLFRFHG